MGAQLLGRWQAHNPAAHLPAQGNGQATQQEDQGEQQHTPEQAGPDDSVRLAPPPPLLSPEALESIMEVLWANMDDAVSYTQRQVRMHSSQAGEWARFACTSPCLCAHVTC